MKKSLIFLMLVFSFSAALAQKEVKRQGNFFFYWGYNRAAYTKSDIHIKGHGYDLTFNDVKATDKPSPLSYEDYIDPVSISKPQYNYRMGYYINDNLSVSIGMDHLKYFMIEDQLLKIDGYIEPKASTQYQGSYDQTEMAVPWRMFWIHHSDGLNYASLELEYNYPFWTSQNKKFYADVIGNVGLGLVVPKTFVMILNNSEDNKFHVAGAGPSVKLGGRFTFFSYFFFESAFKSGYVWMPNIIVNSEGSAKARQHFGWTEFYGAIGFSVPLGRNKSDASNETP